MNRPNRTLAVTTIVLGVFFILVSIALLVGVWMLQARLTTAVNNLFEIPNRLLTIGVNEIDKWVMAGQVANSAVDELSGEIENINQTIQENPVVFMVVDSLTNGKLSPALEQVQTLGQSVYTLLSEAQTALRSMELLFLFADDDGIVNQVDSFLTEWINNMETLSADIRTFTTAVQDAKNQTGQVVTDAMLRALERIGSGLGKLQALLDGIRDRLVDLQARVNTARLRVLNLIMFGAVIISLVCIALLVSQVLAITLAAQNLRAAPQAAALEAAPAAEKPASPERLEPEAPEEAAPPEDEEEAKPES